MAGVGRDACRHLRICRCDSGRRRHNLQRHQPDGGVCAWLWSREKLASTGPFEAKGGTCETYLKDVPKGPFYIYGGVPTGALSWTAGSDKSAQVFCLANGPHFVIRNSDYLKEGKLACPDNAVIGFKLIPAGPEKRPKFTFTEGNADRP